MEIVAELAAHLEELYQDFRRQSLSEQEAIERALVSVPEWARVRRDIHDAELEEDSMNPRTKHIWLPGLMTLAVSSSLLYAWMRAGVYPVFVGTNPHESLGLHIPWLLCLPLVSGLGCFWSKRAGGGGLARLSAGLFPALVMTAVFIVILPVALAIDHPVPPALQLRAFGFYILNAVLVPGVALLLGSLPFLKRDSGKTLDGGSRVGSEKGKNSVSTNRFTLFLAQWTRQGGTARA